MRDTKAANKTFNTSKYEIYVKAYFDNNNIEYIQNYRSSAYPFNCDFYLPKYNLYIELNICWTHGFMPYTESDIKCRELLSIWTEKAKYSDFYKNALETWTKRDVKKLEYFNKNNLSYLILYNKNFDIIKTSIENKLLEISNI